MAAAAAITAATSAVAPGVAADVASAATTLVFPRQSSSLCEAP